MILAITDSAELAIVYAANIGGIMMGKLSIQTKNLAEHMEKVKKRMEADGYVSTFFRGEQYVFVSMPNSAFSLSKMADYDAKYLDIDKRPIPYLPDTFTYQCRN